MSERAQRPDAATAAPAAGAGDAAPDAIARVIASATRLGMELDEHEAAEWIAAMEAESNGGDLVVDVDSGVYGHRISMLDFQPQDLARFREMAAVVGFEDRPPQVLTALSISGSAAQGKVNTYPADCDFFERIHIIAETREAACAILAELIHDKAVATASGPGHRLWEVKFGTHDRPGAKGGKAIVKGAPMSWTIDEIRAGLMELELVDGSTLQVTWADAAKEPGWCKLDWVIADRTRGKLANASNMLDPTWEGPDGTIVPLDGFLDPYFQEVYLETDSIPLFSRLVKELSADAVDDYVEALRHEIWKYTVQDPNYGKAARRMYNVFRLDGHYAEAAYLRELFDEPVTALYQVAAMIRTLDDAARSGDAFETETLVTQCDRLIMSAVQALEGPREAEMVAHLLHLRDALRARRSHADEAADLGDVQSVALSAVNDYFERMLRAVPEIDAYLADIARHAPGVTAG
ncbi:MAG: hypothetical protein ACRDF7_04760 [Candidatus Limnocylindrales bacterium]